MPKSSSRSAAREGGKDGNGERASLYEEVTTRIVSELEAGRFPWVQPWGKIEGPGVNAAPGLPRNAVTARPYSGVNILILWCAVIENSWPSQGWLTFRQAREAGGCVRKGEHGVSVVYADRFTPRGEAERAARDGDEARAVPFLKRFTLFNVAQCDGLPLDLGGDPVPLDESEIEPVARQVIAASGVEFRIGGDKAFYAPGADFVAVPPQAAFFDPVNWHRTAFHELCHATGHAKRLNRDMTNPFGSKDYAREELIAEMGSAFLCAALGIVPTVLHADYLGAWLDVLREDNRAIFRAASAASKAADWLLSRHHEAARTREDERIAA